MEKFIKCNYCFFEKPFCFCFIVFSICSGASADGIISYLDLLQPQPTLHGQWLIWSSGRSYDIAIGGGALKHNLVFYFILFW